MKAGLPLKRGEIPCLTMVCQFLYGEIPRLPIVRRFLRGENPQSHNGVPVPYVGKPFRLMMVRVKPWRRGKSPVTATPCHPLLRKGASEVPAPLSRSALTCQTESLFQRQPIKLEAL